MIAKYPTPIEMPEIGILIAKYLRMHALIHCICVNKTWYSMFLPFIWKHVNLVGDLDQQGDINEAVIEKHSRFIHSITFKNTIDLNVIPTCSNLQSIKLNIAKLNTEHQQLVLKRLTELLAKNPTITIIDLSHGIFTPDIYSQLPNLRHLKLYSYDSIDYSAFLGILEMGINQLEVLSMSFCLFEFQEVNSQINEMVLDSIKELDLEFINVPLTYGELGLAKLCPNLERFRYYENFGSSPARYKEFARLMSERTWPKLSRVLYQSLILTDHEVAEVLKSMDQCHQWVTPICEFGPQAFHALKEHFQTLTDINLRYSPLAESKMLQEILSSCPRLIYFHGPQIMAEDIASGNQWVCLSLKVFEAFIGFESMKEVVMNLSGHSLIPEINDQATESPELNSQQESFQMAVFKQLSRLWYIRHLSIGQNDSYSGYVSFERGLDLRIGKGFELLYNFPSIEYFDFRNTLQLMGEDEVYWMIKNWRSLGTSNGKYFYKDSVKNNELENIINLNRNSIGRSS